MINTKPILFSAPMVQALLREIRTPGTGKTQTRRIIKPQPIDTGVSWQFEFGNKKTGIWANYPKDKQFEMGLEGLVKYCPYGKPGDLLYVKETWTHTGTGVWTTQDTLKALDGRVEYRASNEIAGAGWFPSIFMFRNFSRITLEITDVRVQRLNQITAKDARSEGVDQRSKKVRQMDLLGASREEADRIYLNACRWEFRDLWASINGPESWNRNDWVWAVSFKPHLINVDEFIKGRAAA